MTWDELQRRLRASFRPVQDSPTWMMVGWTFPGEAPTRQLASVALQAAADRPWLVIGAIAGPMTALSPDQALLPEEADAWAVANGVSQSSCE